MKATLLTSAIALLALSATAAPQQTAPAEQQAANVPQQTISQPAPAQTGDSPLVAAAKRTNRLGKKPATVITNESLVKSGGHFTTTKSQDNLNSQPASSNALPTPAVAEKKAPPPPPSKKADPKAAEKKEKVLQRAVADYLGESVEEAVDDPSTQEAVASKGIQVKQAEAPKPAQAPAAAQKPPQF